MITSISKLIEKRELLYMITWREIRVKYKQSVMGFLWAILMPMIIVSAGIMVKYAFATISGKDLTFDAIVSVSVKSLPWAFFASAIRFSSNSLIGNKNLVTKIYMPREIFPIAAILSHLVDFSVAVVTLAIVLAISGISISMYFIWVPFYILLLVLFTLGLALLLSAACLFFRDVKYIVEVIITFAIFFTPVFYEAQMFGKWADVLMLNPLAPILEGLKMAVVDQQMPDLGWTLYSAIFAILSVAIGFYFFKKWEPRFAESI